MRDALVTFLPFDFFRIINGRVSFSIQSVHPWLRYLHECYQFLVKKKRHLSGRSMTDNWAKVGIQLVNINFSSIGTMCSSLEQLMIALALFKKKTKRFCCPGGKNEFINWSTSEEKRKRSLQSLLICPDRRKSWTNGCSQPTHSFQSWPDWSTMRWPSSFSSWTGLVLIVTLSWSTSRWGYYTSSISSTLFIN